MLLEVCVDSPEGLLAAVTGGADRVELCSALALGGLTPTTTMIASAGVAEVPCVVMIRPRPGNFIWTEVEIDHMTAEIDEAMELGADGIVIGANRPDGRLDSKVLKRLLAQCDPDAQKVLHRCIDLTPDPVEAVETAIQLGFDRILTSGGALRAVDGLGKLKAMFDRARGRIDIMPGAGIRADNIAALRALLPLTSVHASCSTAYPQDPRLIAMGLCPETRHETDVKHVRALRRALDGA
jgi:copper homeostasis protein